MSYSLLCVKERIIGGFLVGFVLGHFNEIEGKMSFPDQNNIWETETILGILGHSFKACNCQAKKIRLLELNEKNVSILA